MAHSVSLERLKAPCPFHAATPRSPSLATFRRIRCVEWDPEGLLGGRQTGHISRRILQKQLAVDAEDKQVLQKQAKLELERRRNAREARLVPQDDAGLIQFFLETEAREMEFEIARCRLRLNDAFLSHLRTRIAELKFAINRPQELEDELVELEALQKVLVEGAEAYDKLAADLSGAKVRLAKLFASKDKKATLLEMVASNELDRSLLVLLDQNIVSASNAGQKEAAEFMEKIRGAVIKYISL